MISKNIYGHFAEHLGHCIYDGIYVGDSNKIIPNTEGVRNDIIAALKKLKVPVITLAGRMFCGYISLEGWSRATKSTAVNDK